jgi:6-phosphogluconolactonase/glucosamine-6-phosphate isomerase/deaminase
MINRIDLTGWWHIKFDERDEGKALGWTAARPEGCRTINVPSCWNEVFAEYHTYDGTAWYFKEIAPDPEELAERVTLCFEGANYRCEVFVNGEPIGAHEGGFTCFSFDVTGALRAGEVNRLAVRVNGEHDEWTLPPEGVDWFNWNGIFRAVYLETTRSAFIEDYAIKTKMDGRVSVEAVLENGGEAGEYQFVATVCDQAGLRVVRQERVLHLAGGQTAPERVDFAIPNPRLWNLGDGYLYRVSLELTSADGRLCDRVEKRFGIREFGISGQKILINGQEVKLVGCSKHDEYPMTARAVTREQLVKDYDLLRQMNANFVRLAHYPHNRLEHELLNELGMVAISEAPLVFLHKTQMTSEATLEKAKRVLAEMIRSEKNETCVMFWSLFIECDTHLPAARKFVSEIIEITKALDDTRIVVMASIRPLEDVTYDQFDVIGVNYWEGWYRNAPVEQAVEWLSRMAERFPDRPLLITSHGWEGMYGVRSYAEKVRWSEDLQSDYLSQVADVYSSFKNIVGEIVWTFADFRVSDWEDSFHVTLHRPRYLERPVRTNHKGMVDFYRRPKSTYYVMRDKFARWQEYVAPAARYGEGLRARVFSDRRTMGNAAAFDFVDRVQALLAEKDSINVLFASAASQVEFMEGLLRNRMFVDWSRINGFHLDEYVGAGLDTAHGFARWLRDHLIDHLPFGRFEPLNGQADDLAAECQRYAGLIGGREFDLACIGIGENGHIAFNDPPVADFADGKLVKVVELDETCRAQQVRDGAFPNLAAVPRQALTLTMPAIMRAGSILCVVPGHAKAMAVWKTLHDEVSTACPATVLRQHGDVQLYLDRESAAL